MKVIILDTETTGLVTPQACEIAYFPLKGTVSEHREIAKLYTNLNSIEALDETFEIQFSNSNSIFNSRFKPNIPINIKASEMTGIYMKDVFDKPNINTFEFPTETEYMIGHNIIYDFNVINNGQKDGTPPIKTKLICTKELAQLVFPKGNGLTKHTLTALAQWLYPEHGENLIKNAHGALTDCKLVYLILLKILTKLPKLETWDELANLCSQGKKSYEELNKVLEEKTIMPFGKYKGSEIKNLPESYLKWCLENMKLSPSMEAAIKKAIYS